MMLIHLKYINGLMDSKLVEPRVLEVWDRFPGGEDMNLLPSSLRVMKWLDNRRQRFCILTRENSYGEFMIFYRMSIEFKNKIMLHCFRKVKCQQGVTIWV